MMIDLGQTGQDADEELASVADMDGDKTLVHSVIASFQILDQLASAGRPLRLTEIAKGVGETKAKVHRHLNTLRRLGVIEQDVGTERYRLGWKLFLLGESAVEHFNLREIAAPFLTAIRDETRETAVLGVPLGSEVQVISVAENSFSKVFVSVKPGNRPITCASAQGRLLLAFAAPEIVDRVLSKPIAQYTPQTLTDRTALKLRLAKIRERLWETSDSEMLEGISALSVPILRDGDQLAGMFSIVGMS